MLINKVFFSKAKGIIANLLEGAGVRNELEYQLLQYQKLLFKRNILHLNEQEMFFRRYCILGRKFLKIRNNNDGRNPTILFTTLRGLMRWPLAVDTILAYALTVRGANCIFLLCDGGLPCCDAKRQHHTNPRICSWCFEFGKRFLDSFGLPYVRTSRFLKKNDISKISYLINNIQFSEVSHFKYRDLQLGQMLHHSLAGYFLRDSLDLNEETLHSVRGFLVTSVALANIYGALLTTLKPDVVIALNGKHISWRVGIEIAQKMGLDVLTYEKGFRDGTILITRNGFANDYYLSDEWEVFKNIPLTRKQQSILNTYLLERAAGGPNSRSYNAAPVSNPETISNLLNLDRKKKIISLFSNIIWDSSVIDKNTIFENMFEWLKCTIDHFMHDPSIQIVVRCHPAEIKLFDAETREKVADYLTQSFQVVPKNTRIVPPDSPISSYTIAQMSKAVIVYTSSIGLEVATMGKPVIVAGNVHYRNKGFTYDPSTKQEYFKLIGAILKSNAKHRQMKRPARRYAYLFFFRSMISIKILNDSDPFLPIQLKTDSINDFLPGADPHLDYICSAILKKHNFVPR